MFRWEVNWGPSASEKSDLPAPEGNITMENKLSAMLVWSSSLLGCISGQGEAAHGRENNLPKYNQPLVCDGSLLDHIYKAPAWCPQGTWLCCLHSLKWFTALMQTSAAAWGRENYNHHVFACRNHITCQLARKELGWCLPVADLSPSTGHTCKCCTAQPGTTHTERHLIGNRRCHFQEPSSSGVPWNTTRYRWRCPSILWHLLHNCMLRKWNMILQCFPGIIPWITVIGAC